MRLFRVLPFIGIPLTGAVAAGCSAGVMPPQPVSATIGNLRAHPEIYAGKEVQLTGKLDECSGWECSICPEQMTTETADEAKCLALEFRPLMAGTGFGEGAMEKVFRFSSVVINARFDPTCLSSPCTDRATVLMDADVVRVIQRRSSNTGLWLEKRTRLTSLPAPIAQAVVAAAYKSGFPKGSSENKPPEVAQALRQFDPQVRAFGVHGQPNKAVACWSVATTNVAWPESLQGALWAPSINDYYRCYEVRKIAHEWVVQVEP